jgi:hypothetical protein
LGIDRNNGGECINRQLVRVVSGTAGPVHPGTALSEERQRFRGTEKRRYRVKNRGVFRFDTDTEQTALTGISRYPCPFITYWYPTLKVIGKTRLENGRYKKEYEKTPETPCRRLLEFPDVGEECKAALRRRGGWYNPVKLKGQADKAVAERLRLNRQKGDTAFGRNNFEALRPFTDPFPGNIVNT